MRDTELRGIVLRKLYEKRVQGWTELKAPDFDDVVETFNILDVFRVCDQLYDHNLIQWKPLHNRGVTIGGIAVINAYGIDAVENGQSPAGFTIIFDHSTQTTINNSTGVQIGNSNTQGNITINSLIDAINNSNATFEQKQEAKNLLVRALENPTISGVIGSSAGALIGALLGS